MRRLTRPHVWLAVALPLAAGIGALLLAEPACTRVERELLQVYRARHQWQTAFDALSAVCGAGLLTYDFDDDYTPRGRWTLTALGLLGAVFYLMAAAQTLRSLADTHRLIGACPAARERQPRPPHPLLVAAVFLTLLAVLLPLSWLAERAGGAETGFGQAAWRTSAAFASLGWTRAPQSGLSAWPVAAVAWIGALGWPAWIVLVRPLRRRHVLTRALCASVGGYVAYLMIAAALICALEGPRPGRGGAVHNPASLSAQPLATRYARSLVQTVSASGAGIPTEALSDRGVSDATKMTLAAVLLAGGLSGSAGGGIKWTFLVAALGAGAVALAGTRRNARDESARRFALAGAVCLLAVVALAVVVTLGLLLIESHTASPYQPQPTFADAFLDASSAVAGGNLSSGLTATVTSRNLIGGMRQSANLYQYGMSWLMLAMLIGRVLPLVVLWRIARRATA